MTSVTTTITRTKPWDVGSSSIVFSEPIVGSGDGVLVNGGDSVVYGIGISPHGLMGESNTTISRDGYAVINVPEPNVHLTGGDDFAVIMKETVDLVTRDTLVGIGQNTLLQCGCEYNDVYGGETLTGLNAYNAFRVLFEAEEGEKPSLVKPDKTALTEPADFIPPGTIPGFIDESRIRTLQSGARHSFLVTKTNVIVAWGDNLNGQLGIDPADQVAGETSYFPPFVLSWGGDEVPFAVFGGESHSVVLGVDGGIWTFGNNGNSQLGVVGGSTHVPTKLSEIPKMMHVTCGRDCTIAISENGIPFIWGTLNGTVYETPTALPVGSGNIVHASVGNSHAVFLTTSGDVLTFGSSTWGQSGLTGDFPFIQYVFATGDNTFAVDLGGTIWGAGRASEDGGFLLGKRQESGSEMLPVFTKDTNTVAFSGIFTLSHTVSTLPLAFQPTPIRDTSWRTSTFTNAIVLLTIEQRTGAQRISLEQFQSGMWREVRPSFRSNTERNQYKSALRSLGLYGIGVLM